MKHRTIRLIQKYLFHSGNDQDRNNEPTADAVPADVSLTPNIRYDDRWPNSFLDLYAHKTPDKKQLVFYLHGGGYTWGDKADPNENAFRKRWLDAGYDMVSVNYALAPDYEYPIPVLQAQEALRYVVDMVKGDPRWDSLIFVGSSAGSQLCGQLLNIQTNPAYAAEMGLSAVAPREMLFAAVLGSSLLDNERFDRADSKLANLTYRGCGRSYFGVRKLQGDPNVIQSDVIRHATAAFPPTFLTDANFATFNDQGLDFKARLEELGVPVEWNWYSREETFLSHGYDVLDGPYAKDNMKKTLAFLSGLTEVNESGNRPIALWNGTVPYNTGEKKTDLLKVKKQPAWKTLIEMGVGVFGKGIISSTAGLDTFTYDFWIAKGNESEYMDDIPTITPYVVPGSDTGVIVVPGGGFLYKEMEAEGHSRARALNERGISAFVLDYRVNPYRVEASINDLRRAVRYVRAHADAFGLSPNKIGTLGFSAGGYIVGAEGLGDASAVPQWEGYTPDALDEVSCRPDFVAMLYPGTGFNRNPSMLAIAAGDDFFDEAKRPALQKEYDLRNMLHEGQPPIFICHGTIDPLKDMQDFTAAVEEAGLPMEKLIIKHASHGLKPVRNAEKRWMDAFMKWLT